MYIYIYIYIYRERQAEDETSHLKLASQVGMPSLSLRCFHYLHVYDDGDEDL